jgi:hypothetical protein
METSRKHSRKKGWSENIKNKYYGLPKAMRMLEEGGGMNWEVAKEEEEGLAVGWFGRRMVTDQ